MHLVRLSLMLLGSGGGGERRGGLQRPYCLPLWYLPPWLVYWYPSLSQLPLLCPLLPLWDPQMTVTWWTKRWATAAPCVEAARWQAYQKSQKLMWHLTKGYMGCHSTSDAPLFHWKLYYRFAGVFALVALVSLPSLCWPFCPCCTVVFVLVPLAGVIAICRTGVSAVVVLALLLLSQWHL